MARERTIDLPLIAQCAYRFYCRFYGDTVYAGNSAAVRRRIYAIPSATKTIHVHRKYLCVAALTFGIRREPPKVTTSQETNHLLLESHRYMERGTLIANYQ